MRIKRLAIGVVIASLAGCAAFKTPAPIVQVQAILPPDDLLTDCKHAPRPPGKTMADLAQAVINERAQLEACDWGDKAALRTWKATNAPAAKK